MDELISTAELCEHPHCPAVSVVKVSNGSFDLVFCGHHFKETQINLAVAGFTQAEPLTGDYALEIASALTLVSFMEES